MESKIKLKQAIEGSKKRVDKDLEKDGEKYKNRKSYWREVRNGEMQKISLQVK